MQSYSPIDIFSDTRIEAAVGAKKDIDVERRRFRGLQNKGILFCIDVSAFLIVGEMGGTTLRFFLFARRILVGFCLGGL
jgi:hypothetical protein